MLHRYVDGYTVLHRGVDGYIVLHRDVDGYIVLHRDVDGYIVLHRDVDGYTVFTAQSHTPTLWAGTNAGTVYIYQVTMPASDKRDSEKIQCQLGE